MSVDVTIKYLESSDITLCSVHGSLCVYLLGLVKSCIIYDIQLMHRNLSIIIQNEPGILEAPLLVARDSSGDFTRSVYSY